MRFIIHILILLVLTTCSMPTPLQTHRQLAVAPPPTPDQALATVQADITKLNSDVIADAKQIGADAQTLHDSIPPAPPTTNESPDGTQIAPGSGTVIDAAGNAWTLGTDTTINENGKGAYHGWQSHQLVYHLHKVFAFGLDGNWYSWNGSAFVPDASPLAPANPAFYVTPTGSDVASGTATAPFQSLGRCEAAMASSPTIKQCNVSATGGGYYDFSTCSVDLTTADDGEAWVGDPQAELYGGLVTAAPFILGPSTGVTFSGFKLVGFTSGAISQ